ncbi:hypothetical protein JTB14_008516 [Gonioctena quinquepunctata]|nr:hypothetical protein JTB14_008516 [Gonioctena quinquepunctata]
MRGKFGHNGAIQTRNLLLKMALTSAGKLRREPCTKCALPVFIAERLNVGKLLFHRTCFRCARCNSQLTLANYYETENEEFCCEVCPDEEKHMFKKTTETLLSRSLSDEEKSASLKMITSEPDEFSAQFESALESVDGDRELESEFAQARSQFFLTQMEGSDSSTEDKPPDIPKSFSAPPKSQPPDLPESSPPHMTKSQPTVLPKSQLPDMPKSKPPDLPKSQPPFLSKSSPPQLRKSDKTDLQDSIVNSAQSDSSFPERLATTVNINNRVSVTKRGSSSLPLDESRNVVTKDKSAEEVGTSMVKARMRLFENNNSQDSFISKSDVNSSSPSSERVPKTPVKSPVTTIPIVKLEELENFDDSSSKRDLPERKNIFVYTPLVALNKEKIKHRVDVDNVSIRSNVEQTDTQNDKSVGNTENIEMKIEDELEYMDNRNEESLVEDVDESLGNPIIEIMDSTEGSQNDIILIEDSPLKSASDSILSKNEEVVISSEETSPVKQQTISSNDTSIVIVISDESLESSVLVIDESKESPVEETSEEEESRLKKGLEKTDSALLACVKEEGSGQKSALEITDDSVSVTEEYPDDLNPFGDDDVKKSRKKLTIGKISH